MRATVKHTSEFERIRALPRRVLTPESAEAWATVLTPLLRAPGSTARLRRWQAQTLAECLECRGVVGWLPVGQGKTLIIEAMAVLLESRRALLVVPAGLRSKTYSDRAELRRDWKLSRNPVRVISFHEITNNPRLLAEYAPDLLMVDEADDASNLNAACTAILFEYVMGRSRDDMVYANVTATPSRHSPLGYWHHVVMALREDAPLPRERSEMSIWAALLENSTRANLRRPLPGPLGTSVAGARAWYRRRLAETPGMIIVDEDSAADIPLTVRTRLAREDPLIDEAFRKFGLDNENPAGIPVDDQLSRWRVGGQMELGFHDYWDPQPSDEWRDANRAKSAFVRDVIEWSKGSPRRDTLYTEGQVLRAFRDDPVVRKWQAVRKTFDPIKASKTAWYSDSGILSALDWLRETDVGIVWCGSVSFAERLAVASRLEYYGRQGVCRATGRELHAAPKGRSLIASWHANKKGFNLQAWPRQLIAIPPQSAKWLEQTFGRSHRAGQRNPVVIDILCGGGGTFDMLDAAIGEAKSIRDREGLTQKILRATIEHAEPVITQSNRFRWARKEK